MEIKTFHGFEDFCVEKFENTDEWYYGIYPTWMSNVEVAEEYGKGREYAGSKLCFFNKTGRSYEPIKQEKNVYLETPVYDKASNSFGILRYNFNKRILQAIAYKPDEESVEVIEEISLSEIDDLMNIRLIESPFMIVRNSMEENESIEFVENEKMYSSQRNEDLLDVLDYGYGEEVIVRDLETGKILERYKGYLNRMPDGTAWLMTE